MSRPLMLMQQQVLMWVSRSPTERMTFDVVVKLQYFHGLSRRERLVSSRLLWRGSKMRGNPLRLLQVWPGNLGTRFTDEVTSNAARSHGRIISSFKIDDADLANFLTYIQGL